MPINYEIVNKLTGEVTALAPGGTFGTESVTFKTVGGEEVVFSNIGQTGALEHDVYAIREVGTHESPDGTHEVEVPSAEAPASAVETPASEVVEAEVEGAADESTAPETAGEAETVTPTE